MPILASNSHLRTYIFRSTVQRRRVLDGPIGQDLLGELDGQDLVGLCFYDTGSRSYYGSKPVRTAGDLEGLKVRVPQSAPWASLLKVPNMTAIPMPFSHVDAALRNGAIDLAENNWPAFVSSGHYKAAKYYSETRHSATPGVLIFSRRTWRQLSPVDQAAIRSAARDSVREFRRLWDQQKVTARQTAVAAGVDVISDVDQASFSNVAAALYRTESMSPTLRHLIKRIQATE